MERALTAAAPVTPVRPASSRVLELTPALERTQRAWVSAVLVLEIVEFSRKSVSEQLLAKERFDALIASAIDNVPAADRIVLDTGDGVAINFLGAPAQALCAAVKIVAAATQESLDTPSLPVRAGINLGPVRLARDPEGQPNIIGDGVSVAQRVANFAEPGQVLVARAYYETVTAGAEARIALFSFQGSRTDKHVREHEIYACAAPAAHVCKLLAGETMTAASARPGSAQPSRGWLSSRTAALGTATVSVLVFLLAAFLFAGERTSTPAPRVPASPTAIKPTPVVPAPSIESAPAPEMVVALQPMAAPAAPAAANVVVPATRARPKPARAAPTPPATQTAAAPTAPSEPVWLRSEPKPEPAPEAHAEPPAEKAPSGPTALVILAISPWGEVLVDGKPVGVSPPLSELEVAPGKHVIEVRNTSFKPYQEDLDLGPNETIKIKHKFIQR